MSPSEPPGPSPHPPPIGGEPPAPLVVDPDRCEPGQRADAGPGTHAALARLRDSVEQPADWTDRLVEAALGHLRSRPLPWLLGLLALAGVALGAAAVAWSRPAATRGAGASYPAGSSGTDGSASGDRTASGDPAGASSDPSSTLAGLVVQVAGAVVHPGVYHLPAGSRVGDLVARSGGLAPDADGDRVNQAAPVTDGSLLYVPHLGQTDVPAPLGGDGSAADGATGADTATTLGAPLDLNTATATQLDALPGVGPATAANIVAYRRQHGAFARVDDLADVSGIGPAKLAEIRPHVRV